jgi:Concanavalin A-like lectin/glucanases superfamily
MKQESRKVKDNTIMPKNAFCGILLGLLTVSAASDATAAPRKASTVVSLEPPTPEVNPWAEQGIPSEYGFGAWYTRKNVDEEWHHQSRTDEFTDVMVRFAGTSGELLFWRGTSYLPCWKPGDRSVPFEEVIPRRGDGPPERPDKVNRYSNARIIESTPERVVIHWRYMPEMPVNVGPTNNLPDQTKMADEYFVVFPDRTVVRAVLAGQARYEEWRQSAPGRLFRYRLGEQGVEKLSAAASDRELMLGVMGLADHKPRVVKPTPLRRTPTDMPKPLAAFSFDEGKGFETVERVSGQKLSIQGHAAHWRAGVSGTALLMDGYTSQVTMDVDLSGKVGRSLTLDAWICIDAYPWNTCPVVQQVGVGPDGLQELDGFMLGLEADSKPSLSVTVNGTRVDLKGLEGLPRFRWIRLTGVVECADDKSTLRLYVDDKLAAETTGQGGSISLPAGQPLRVAQGVKRKPARTVGKGQYPTQYSFEGMIDEVAVYPVALTAEQIAANGTAWAVSEKERDHPDMERHVLPAGSKEWNTFGARLTHLPFHEAFDRMFRFCGHPDLVVSFDKMPCRYVLWHGAGYIPMLVSENGRWYSNEFNETWPMGCCEPMSDKKVVFGNVHIIEQSPARVVLKWRYPLSEVGYRIAYEDPASGWGDWSDWYFVIYPDGTVVKRLRCWTIGGKHEWQESMAIMGPEQRPEMVLETTPALTLVTTNGAVREYAWIDAPPKSVDYTDAVVHVVNLKAAFDPYSIQRITKGDIYEAGGGSKYSAFPAWNHWPVAQVLSDGRHASFPDRTAHSSATHIQWKLYEQEARISKAPFIEKLLLEGMSDRPAKELLPLALSWLQPAPITSLTEGLAVTNRPSERAYILTRANAGVKNLRISLAGSAESPIVNPVAIVENWGQDRTATITLDGRKPDKAIDIRQGLVTRANGVKALVVWIEHTRTAPLEIGIE